MHLQRAFYLQMLITKLVTLRATIDIGGRFNKRGKNSRRYILKIASRLRLYKIPPQK